MAKDVKKEESNSIMQLHLDFVKGKKKLPTKSIFPPWVVTSEFLQHRGCVWILYFVEFVKGKKGKGFYFIT